MSMPTRTTFLVPLVSLLFSCSCRNPVSEKHVSREPGNDSEAIQTRLTSPARQAGGFTRILFRHREQSEGNKQVELMGEGWILTYDEDVAGSGTVYLVAPQELKLVADEIHLGSIAWTAGVRAKTLTVYRVGSALPAFTSKKTDAGKIYELQLLSTPDLDTVWNSLVSFQDFRESKLTLREHGLVFDSEALYVLVLDRQIQDGGDVQRRYGLMSLSRKKQTTQWEQVVDFAGNGVRPEKPPFFAGAEHLYLVEYTELGPRVVVVEKRAGTIKDVRLEKSEGLVFGRDGMVWTALGSHELKGAFVLYNEDLEESHRVILELDLSPHERKHELLEEGVLYIAHWDPSINGAGNAYRLSAFDVSDGHLLWQSEPETAMDDKAFDVSRPKVHDGLVYACLPDGNLHGYDVQSGKEAWYWGTGDCLDFDFIRVLKGEREVEVLVFINAANEIVGLERSDEPLPEREVTVRGRLTGDSTKNISVAVADTVVKTDEQGRFEAKVQAIDYVNLSAGAGFAYRSSHSIHLLKDKDAYDVDLKCCGDPDHDH